MPNDGDIGSGYLSKRTMVVDVEQAHCIFYYYSSTLSYLKGRVAVEACCLSAGWWERTRDIRLLSSYMRGIYSSNLL